MVDGQQVNIPKKFQLESPSRNHTKDSRGGRWRLSASAQKQCVFSPRYCSDVAGTRKRLQSSDRDHFLRRLPNRTQSAQVGTEMRQVRPPWPLFGDACGADLVIVIACIYNTLDVESDAWHKVHNGLA